MSRVARTSQRRDRPPGSSAAGAGLAALAFVALVSFTAPVQAQTDTLVSNFASRGSSSVPVGDAIGDGQVTVQAQRFVTGPSAAGYTLSSVKFFADIDFSGNNVTVKVSIYSADADGNPDSELFVLTGTATTRGEHTFNAPANSLLADSTSYFVYFEDTNLGTEEFSVRLRYGVRKADDGKTAEGLPGWAIEDRYQKVDTGSWEASSDAIVAIELTGAVANTAPTASNGTVTTDEDTAHTFAAGEFNFADTDTGDMLTSVKVVTLPSVGTLALADTAVTPDQVVPVAEIGDLVFTPVANANGTGYASFTFKVSDGTAESADAYTMTVNVTAVNDAATGLPTISGTAQVGATLTAATTDIADPDGLPASFSYQWVRVDSGTDTDISGATSSTYTPVDGDLGKTLKVEVSFTDDGGSSEGPLTSAATATIEAAPVNNAPVFSDSTLTRSIAENTSANTNIGDVIPAATDADMDDLEYSMEGDDAASFNFNVTTRQISTKSGVTYNFEATKNSYSVTIKADDGNGGTDTVDVTIDITDVDEPPDTPAAPTVTATPGSATSLDVEWTAPDNAGKPAVTYFLQYRVGDSGNFRGAPDRRRGQARPSPA